MVQKLKMALHSMTCDTRRKRLHEKRVLIKMSGWLYLGAIDKIETFLKNSHYGTKKGSQNREP